MSEYMITVCDACNPAADINSLGVFNGYEMDALQDGWQEREYGIVCPDCAFKEAEQAALDEEQGAVSVVGLDIPENDE